MEVAQATAGSMMTVLVEVAVRLPSLTQSFVCVYLSEIADCRDEGLGEAGDGLLKVLRRQLI